MDVSTLLFGPVSFQKKGSLVNFHYSHIFIENPVFNANSLEPDQMTRSVASDLVLH